MTLRDRGIDPAEVRRLFPALQRRVGGRNAVYLDGPGGTQVPQSVIDAMAEYLRSGGSNHGGPFVTSEVSERVVDEARQSIADLFNASSSDEIAFGQNMTSLTLSMSRAISRTWASGDEIVLTRLDHDANVWPWVIASQERGVDVKFADFDVPTGTLSVEAVRSVIGPRTRLVAVPFASNALGTIVDVAGIAEVAHQAGALVYVDAVHYTPHGSIDVRAIDADFLLASAYKFFGPHTGVVYGKLEWLDSIAAVKIRPAPQTAPGKWETGTQSFESLAGVSAAVNHIATLGTGTHRRAALVDAMANVVGYEQALSRRFIDGIAAIEGVRLYGLPTAESRTPTFAVSVEGMHPKDVASRLGEIGIFVWWGHYYAVEVMRRLGVIDEGGLVRIGFVHYSTEDEVRLVVDALAALAAGESIADLNPPVGEASRASG